MADKQIIIDGVDVSGCEWIREIGLDSEYICTCNSPNKTSGYCKYNPNCCYKQLKRKEQECEFSNLRIIQLQETLSQYETELDQLKAENENLKEARKNSRCAWKSLEGTFCPEAQEQLDRLKQAIARIKELIQKEIDDCEHRDDCTSCEYNCCIRQAMQICNEVISE